MKFFVVILAVIGIESISNCAAQSDSDEISISVTRDKVTEFGADILSLREEYPYTYVKFKKNIDKGDLRFVMDLNEGDNVVVAEDGSNPHDFCEDSLQGEIVRSGLLAMDETSCPVKAGEYLTGNPYFVDTNKTQTLSQMKCGYYTGRLDITQDGNNNFLYVSWFSFGIDNRDTGCEN